MSLSQVDDSWKHFYGSVGLCQVSYEIQKLTIPKQKEGWRIANSFFISTGIGILKEVNDKYRCNRNKRTGMSLSDGLVNFLGNGTWVECKIVFNDLKRKNYEIYKDPFSN